jgi:GABA(A) receptor-associated protein
MKNQCYVFKKKPFEERFAESTKMKELYPDKIPIILDLDPFFKNITKYKFLIPSNLTVAHLLNSIRTIVKLEKEKALFIFVNETIPPITQVISNLYSAYSDPDGFLYVSVALESVFGSCY